MLLCSQILIQAQSSCSGCYVGCQVTAGWVFVPGVRSQRGLLVAGSGRGGTYRNLTCSGPEIGRASCRERV